MSNGGRDRAAPSNRRSRSNAAMPANLDPPPRLSIPEEPPKVPRRPPSKGNKRETLADIAKRIPVQLMRQYFNYPLRSAAEAMHISVTTLKRLCRRHGVKRWPHRQISGINRALNDLENQHQAAGDGDCGAVADQLRQLHRRREVIIELAFESDEEASRKGSADAPPPAAHKRGHRATASSDSNSSSNNSSASSTTAPSSPRPRSDSLVEEAPKSPGSATSIGGESKPTAAWWQSAAAPGSDESSALSGGGMCKALGDSSASSSVASSTAAEEAVGVEVDAAAAAGVDAGAAAGVGAGAGAGSAAGVRRPRRPSGTAAGSTATSTSSRGGGGGGGSGSSKTARTQRSSAMFGNIPRPGKARTTAHRRRKSGNDIAPAVTGAVRRYSVSAPSTSPVAFAGGVPSPAAPSRMSVGGGGGGGGGGAGGGMGMGVPACHQLPAAVAGVAAVSGRAVCGSMFDQGVQVNQQMDDLAALGDLLFGPDETAAAAAAEAKGNGFLAAYPDIFAPSTSHQQWTAPYVPFCPPGVFSHDQSLLGAPSSFASHDPGFLTGMAFSSWGGLGSERHGLGAPPSSVGPL